MASLVAFIVKKVLLISYAGLLLVKAFLFSTDLSMLLYSSMGKPLLTTSYYSFQPFHFARMFIVSMHSTWFFPVHCFIKVIHFKRYLCVVFQNHSLNWHQSRLVNKKAFIIDRPCMFKYLGKLCSAKATIDGNITLFGHVRCFLAQINLRK